MYNLYLGTVLELIGGSCDKDNRRRKAGVLWVYCKRRSHLFYTMFSLVKVRLWPGLPECWNMLICQHLIIGWLSSRSGSLYGLPTVGIL